MPSEEPLGSDVVTVKSIVEIDVRSQEFQRFQQLFDKYLGQLKQTQSTWGQLAKQHTLVAGQTRSWVAALLTGKVLVRDVVEGHKDQNKHLVTGEKLWTSIAKSSKSVASDIAGATRFLLHWTKI